MTPPKVSIIVPVYNRENTLGRSLKSIKEQTFSDFEVLLINDGSTDASKAIIEECIKDDSRFRVINKDNGGVASARQLGKNIANGDYAIHVDPDDWIEPSMLQDLYMTAISEHSDMVICDILEETDGQQNVLCQQPEQCDYLSVLSGLFKNQHGSCCNKLISRKFYKSENFEPDINITEDLLYISKILLKGPKITYISYPYYHYVISSGTSQSKIFKAERFFQIQKSFTQLLKLTSNYQDIQFLIRRKFIPYLGYIGLKSKDLSASAFRKAFKGNYIFFLRNAKLTKEKVAFILALLGGKRLLSLIIK